MMPGVHRLKTPARGLLRVQTAANLSVGRVDLVAQSEVQSKARSDAPHVLCVAARCPLPQPSVELAAALKELHGLTQKKARKGIAGRGRSEYKEGGQAYRLEGAAACVSAVASGQTAAAAGAAARSDTIVGKIRPAYGLIER
jgi:hypothetical protein